jgi:hypothetical protein
MFLLKIPNMPPKPFVEMLKLLLMKTDEDTFNTIGYAAVESLLKHTGDIV